MNEPRRITIKEAAEYLEMPEQGVREHIKKGYFGSFYGKEGHRAYYVTDEQVRKFKKGTRG